MRATTAPAELGSVMRDLVEKTLVFVTKPAAG
jgi:hypothetical protein